MINGFAEVDKELVLMLTSDNKPDLSDFKRG